MATGFGGSYQGASDMIYDFTCTPCEDNHLNSEAFHYCKVCMKQYCVNCCTMHDRLFKNHDVFGKKDIQQWGKVKKDVTLEMCEDHGDKELEMFCTDHDAVCCTVCVSLKHRSCKNIQHVPDIAKGIKKKVNFKNLPTNVDKMKTNLNKAADSRKKNNTKLKQEYDDLLTSIKQFRTKCNNWLDQIQKRTEDELTRLLANADDVIQSDIDRCTEISKEMTRLLKISHGNASTTDTEAFVAFKKCNDHLTEAKGFVGDISQKTHKITFTFGTSIEETLSPVTMFGKFETLPSAFSKRSSTTKKAEIYCVLETKKFSVDTENDAVDSSLQDICQLSDGRVVVLDGTNFCVKVLDEDFSVVAEHITPYGPSCVCKTPTGFAVSMIYIPEQKYWVQLMNETNGIFSTLKTIKLKHECRAIAHNDQNSHMYVASKSAIYERALNGTLVRKIYEDKTAYHETVTSFVIHDDCSRIYVANSFRKKVYTLDMGGNILAVFSDPDLQRPYSVCMAVHGHVFVCCMDTCNVLKLDSDGEHKLANIASKKDGIEYPTALLFDRMTNQLIVTQF